MDLAQILELVRQHGNAVYALVFGYAAAHSLILVLFAGYAAQVAALDWLTLVLVCWTGSFVGDVIRFWIGRRFGIAWLGGFPRLHRGVQRAARLVDRHYLWLPLVHRYPHGIRNLAGFAFGISRLPWPTFLVLNFVAAGVWAFVLVSAGYAFGQVAEATLNNAASGLGMTALVVFLGLAWVLSHKLERVVERK
jgi:membrane protein DedA with SNARE-associated domain